MPSRNFTEGTPSHPPSHQLPRVPVLQPFTSPLGTLDSLKVEHYEMRIDEVEVAIPAAFTPATYIPYIINMTSSELWDRIEFALHYGRKVLKRPLRERRLSKREEGIFKEELDMFRKLLTNVVQVTLPDGTMGYFIHPTGLRIFRNMLKERREEARDSLVAKRIPAPLFPVWGRAGDAIYVWDWNEFEILSACYRVEVEGFLGTLADYHDFKVDRAPVPISTNESRESTSMKRNSRHKYDVTTVPKSETSEYSLIPRPPHYNHNSKPRTKKTRGERGKSEEPLFWRKRTTRRILITEVEEEYYPVRK